MKKTIESALFLAGRKMSIKELCSILGSGSEDEVKEHLQALQKEYRERDSPIEITEENGHFKMDLKPEYLDKVKFLAPQMDLSRALLTTLSYVAFKQPIKQSVMVKKFGNRIYEYVRELERRGLLSSERRERTKLLTTTKKLLSYLGKDDLERLKKPLEAAKLEKMLKEEIIKEDSMIEIQKKQVARRKPRKIKLRAELEKKREVSLEEWAKVFKQEKEEKLLKQLELFEKEINSKEGLEAEEEFEEFGFKRKNAEQSKE